MQLSNIGVKGRTELLPGLNGVFWASTLFNPQSGQLQSAPGAIIANQGLNYRAYSINLDGARGGQAFNDQLYVGFSNKTFGQLTFGRHRSLASDLLSAYDATGGSFGLFNHQLVRNLCFWPGRDGNRSMGQFIEISGRICLCPIRRHV